MWKWRPFNTDFNFGNKKTSHGVRSGEYDGWEKTTFGTKLTKWQRTTLVDYLTLKKKFELHNFIKKKTVSITLTLVWDMHALFERGNPSSVHCDYWISISMSFQWKFSPVSYKISCCIFAITHYTQVTLTRKLNEVSTIRKHLFTWEIITNAV